MSYNRDPGTIGPEALLALGPELPSEVRRRAALAVATALHPDHAEARTVLDMLGLLA